MKPKSNKNLCQLCHKNKATLNYASNTMSWAHGFVKQICESCYDKIKKDNDWYKSGVQDILQNVNKIMKSSGNIIEARNRIQKLDISIITGEKHE